ncbi:DUF1573 domain-containing protein [Mesoterricola silvestris]|uniref:DUF1573 domain-containing protein n=1 Tax=Mesoterricola silvestris TaxID=2927979 RepID=A0AA48HB06_9BACT|nr:DUF1573 domain-containing protein [Mesoterricola silvestris]BDU75003.1 hypothetical protein METEAL_41770 [Mesoterricola silvestris]
MRSILSSLLVPALCMAQAPVISVDQPHFDFGKLYGDAKAVHRFRISNKGNAPLNISRLNPSCGCTSTVIGQWTLNPGQSTEVEATFNPAGFRGTVHKSIQVVSNDPANPTVDLTFEAELLREIMPSTEAVFFQDVLRTSPRKASVRLVSGNGKPVRVTEVKAPGAPYLHGSARAEGNDAWVDILVDGSRIPASRTSGTDAVVVKTDNPRAALINLTVQWELRASVVAEPGRVAWVEPAGRELRSKVVLKQVDGKPFRVLSARTTNPVIRVEGAGKGAASHQDLQVILAANAKAGMYSEKVILTTDSPDQPEVEIRVAASLR